MHTGRKPRGYWNKERIFEEARRYTSRKEWRRGSYGSLLAAGKLGVIEEATAHMARIAKPRTKEECAVTASKYSTRNEFQKLDGSTYQRAFKLGWLDEICQHMPVRADRGRWKWPKEACAAEAKLYSSRRDFCLGSGSAYAAALSEGWLDDVCTHMRRASDADRRGLYAFEFTDGSVYVGLTKSYKRRLATHVERSPWLLNRVNNGIDYKFITFNVFYPPLEAAQREGELVASYRNNGWTVLNQRATGGLGSCKAKWTKERCLEEAKKYATIREWSRGSQSSYVIACNKGWKDECIAHMDRTRRPNGYWTRDAVFASAARFSDFLEWKLKEPGACRAAYRMGLIAKITHISPTRKRSAA